jgi:hypothetical protein
MLSEGHFDEVVAFFSTLPLSDQLLTDCVPALSKARGRGADVLSSSAS